MNFEAIEAAKTINDVMHAEDGVLSPDVQTDLVQKLSITGVGIEALKYKDRSEQANVEFLRKFVTRLPSKTYIEGKFGHAKSMDSDVFMAKDAAEAQAIRGSVLWVRTAAAASTIRETPYFVVGFSQDTALVISTGLKKQGYIANPHRGLYRVEAKNLLQQRMLQGDLRRMQAARHTALSDEEMAGMYDRESETLLVGTTKDSIPKKMLTPIDRLSDADIARFNVPLQLSLLEQSFGTYPALNECYDEMAQSLSQ